MPASSALPHFGGSVVLFGLAHQLPDANGLIAALAAAGLFLTGLSQVLKQTLDLYRGRQALAAGYRCPQPLADLGCPYGQVARNQCAARPAPSPPPLAGGPIPQPAPAPKG